MCLLFASWCALLAKPSVRKQRFIIDAYKNGDSDKYRRRPIDACIALLRAFFPTY